MRALALLLWLVVFALTIAALQLDKPGKTSAELFNQTERSLLAIAPAPEESQAELVLSLVSAPAADTNPALTEQCSRLGIFPRRDWAENVAVILTAATKTVTAQAWRVQKVGLNAYYLQFDAWSVDELATRMTTQRAFLKKLLSINAIPEPC